MTERLDIRLPEGLNELANALVSAGHDALLVGGAVRDALLGREVCDFDLVTDAPVARVNAAADTADGVVRTYAVGERFGTIGVVLAGGATVEVSQYRPDALDAEDVEARFEVDAGHRDFTVDAMALSLVDGRLLDPLGGGTDLEARILKAPGAPAARFAEDPLRVLRGARLAAQLGFTLEEATAEALALSAPRLADVAVERVRTELTKLLLAPQSALGLEILRGSGALGVVLPEVAALDGLEQPSFHDLDVLGHTVQALGHAPATPVLRWATLLHDVGKAPTRSIESDGRIRFFGHAQEGALIAEQICVRLRFSNDDTCAVVHLVAEHMRLGEMNVDNARSVDRAVRKLDMRRGDRLLASAEDALDLMIADFSATAHREEAPARAEQIRRAIEASRERGSRVPVVSPVSGADLIRELGLAEGPAVGAAKRAVVDAICDGTLGADDVSGALVVARQAVASRRWAP